MNLAPEHFGKRKGRLLIHLPRLKWVCLLVTCFAAITKYLTQAREEKELTLAHGWMQIVLAGKSPGAGAEAAHPVRKQKGECQCPAGLLLSRLYCPGPQSTSVNPVSKLPQRQIWDVPLALVIIGLICWARLLLDSFPFSFSLPGSVRDLSGWTFFGTPAPK